MSDACTNEPSGEDLCIRQLDGCGYKTEIDLTCLDLNVRQDLMGLVDLLRIWTMLWF